MKTYDTYYIHTENVSSFQFNLKRFLEVSYVPDTKPCRKCWMGQKLNVVHLEQLA